MHFCAPNCLILQYNIWFGDWGFITFFVVMFRHSQHLAKVKERLWSGLTKKIESEVKTLHTQYV